MTQKSIKVFIDDFYSKAPEKSYATFKTDVFHIDNTWSFAVSDLTDYGPENKSCYRYVLVVIDIFSKSSWTFSVKKKNDQTINDSFENNFITSKRKKTKFNQNRSRK